MVPPGRYRHYKGQEYEVLGVARHSETEERFVVYRALYGEDGLWIRPKENFLEPVVVEGKPVPRFQLIAAASCLAPSAFFIRETSTSRRSRPGRHGSRPA
ncbi:MAG: DUF1653 domain-containing protein [Nitrospirae bacterium]|nr:DUF1653 domain-containing protein [Nitrospirota bacterium]